uniref:Uncharacterized protein n=1 Tax=Romanomermis culicivorax TaxID=13658 RepID=A0A915HPE4_ROMCU
MRAKMMQSFNSLCERPIANSQALKDLTATVEEGKILNQQGAEMAGAKLAGTELAGAKMPAPMVTTIQSYGSGSNLDLVGSTV